jgi:two-component system, chemotaxis family, chemotaxis protein CheY
MGSGSVLIVDDEGDIRTLVRALIGRSSNGLEVVGEASDGDEALELFRQLEPDVVVLDYRMPRMDGVTCAREILQIAPDQKLLLFSAYLDPATQAAAAELGVDCVAKTRMTELPARLSELATR